MLEAGNKCGCRGRISRSGVLAQWKGVQCGPREGDKGSGKEKVEVGWGHSPSESNRNVRAELVKLTSLHI